MAMILLLTTDEEANLSKMLLVRRSIGNAKRMGQRCVGRPEVLQNEDQITRVKHKRTLVRSSNSGDGRRGNAYIASTKQKIATEATFWRKYLLRTINIDMALAMRSLALRGHREHVGNGDCHGGNFLALVAMQAWFDPVLQDLLQTPARTAKCLNATIQTVNCLSQLGKSVSTAQMKKSTRHIIHTIRNTRNIRNTTL